MRLRAIRLPISRRRSRLPSSRSSCITPESYAVTRRAIRCAHFGVRMVDGATDAPNSGGKAMRKRPRLSQRLLLVVGGTIVLFGLGVGSALGFGSSGHHNVSSSYTYPTNPPPPPPPPP